MLSIFLIIVTFIIHSQLQYVQTKDLGFDKENILSLPSSPLVLSRFENFKAELSDKTGIKNISLSGYLPGRPIPGEDFRPVEDPQGKSIGINLTAGDENFKDTLGLELNEGRFFSQEIASDNEALVINETAARKMNSAFGWDTPLDKKITTGRSTYSIIGVLKDFHFLSLHREIQPLAIVRLSSQRGPFIAFRIDPKAYSQALRDLEKTWNNYTSGQPFEIVSFGNETEKLYQSEKRTAKMLNLFSLLAVVLGCLGLFGLAAFTVEQQTKEIGIRKVLGASQGGLIIMLIKRFSLWVLAANILAWPAAFYIMARWLESFAYRTNIKLVLFLGAGFLALILACMTVGIQAIKAARANPVDALKYE
jgi:putative ABC transport system permease protein